MPNCCAMVPIGASLDSSRRMASALNSGLNCRRRRRAIVDSSAHCAPSEVSTKTDQFHLPFVLCLCPLSFALCPLPFALCPLSFALCPLSFALSLSPRPIQQHPHRQPPQPDAGQKRPIRDQHCGRAAPSGLAVHQEELAEDAEEHERD